MFKDNSILKDVNIFNKLFCFILSLVAIILCRQILLLIFINLTFILFTKPYKKLLITNIINILLLIPIYFYPQLMWINKIIIFILYTVLLKKVTKVNDLRFILESTLYRFQTKRITYYILYGMYFTKYYLENIKYFMVLKDDYEIKLNIKFLIFIIKKSFNKTKLQLTELMEINRLRFYNYSNKRTYIEKNKWESWDTTFLVSHIIVFFLILFYGR